MPTFIEKLAEGWRQRQLPGDEASNANGASALPPVVQGYYCGLDLGQAMDYTAWTVLERRAPGADDGPDPRPVYHCRDLRRWPLKTDYVTICQDVSLMMALPPLAGQAHLVVDGTGVGQGIVDILHRLGLSRQLTAVTITSGRGVTLAGPGAYHVAKVELISLAQLVLQSRRLRVSPKLAEATTLLKELSEYQVKITDSGRDVFGAWRQGRHDDVLLAVALATWGSEYELGAVTNFY